MMKLRRASGSRNSSISPASGIRVGLETCETSPPCPRISYVTVGGAFNQRERLLAFEPLLHDLHMEHAQEAAPEAKPCCIGRFGPRM